MFKLIGAFGRFFRAIFYSFSGDVSKWSEVWESSTGYIHSEYDSIEKEQRTDVAEMTDAVAGLMDIVGQKEERFEQLTISIQDKRKKQAGAKAKAENRKQELMAQGLSVEQIKADSTIQKCLDYFNGFASDLNLLEDEASALEKELATKHQAMDRYKVRLQKAHKELEKIKSERHETVADMKLSQQEQKVNDMLLGLSESKTTERRQRIQDLRRKQRNRADIKAEMAGVVTEDAEQEFLDFATTTEAESEFFKELGLASKSPEKVEAAQADSEAHIPE